MSPSSEHERGTLASLRAELEQVRCALAQVDAELQRLESGGRRTRERARPERYYEVLIGVYEHGRHGIDAASLADLAERHGYDRRGLNGFLTGGRAALRRRDQRVVLTAEGERLLDAHLKAVSR